MLISCPVIIIIIYDLMKHEVIIDNIEGINKEFERKSIKAKRKKRKQTQCILIVIMIIGSFYKEPIPLVRFRNIIYTFFFEKKEQKTIHNFLRTFATHFFFYLYTNKLITSKKK